MKLIVLVGLMFSLFSFFFQEKSYPKYLENLYETFDIKQIKPSDLNQLSNKLIIDTRSKEEFNVSHIENAIHIEYDDFDINEMASFNKNDTLVFYCSVGYRSCKVGEKFVEAGFLKVFNLYGGIFKWSNEGRIIVTSDKTETNNLHVYNKKWGNYVTNDSINKIY